MMAVIHLLGVFLLFSGFGALALASADEPRARKLGSMAHGIGLVIILVTGISLLVSWGLSDGMPAWAWGKIVIWLVLGAATVAFKRAPNLKVPLFFLLPVLGAIAAWLALTQPGG